jgi:hypothetical protein
MEKLKDVIPALRFAAGIYFGHCGFRLQASPITQLCWTEAPERRFCLSYFYFCILSRHETHFLCSGDGFDVIGEFF